MKVEQESACECASLGPRPACPSSTWMPATTHTQAGSGSRAAYRGLVRVPNLRPCPCGPGLRGGPSEQLPRERPSRPLRLSLGEGKGARAGAGGRMVRPEAEAPEEGEAFLRRYALAQATAAGTGSPPPCSAGSLISLFSGFCL